MTEGQTQTVAESQASEPQAQANQEPKPQAQAQAAQADTTDWKAEARKWEQRAKENKSKADAYDEAQEAAKSDLQKALERAEKAEKLNAEYEAEKERIAAVKAAAASTGVDFELLSMMQGNTPDEIAANAETLKAKLAAQQKYPSVSDNGEQKAAKPRMTEFPQVI